MTGALDQLAMHPDLVRMLYAAKSGQNSKTVIRSIPGGMGGIAVKQEMSTRDVIAAYNKAHPEKPVHFSDQDLKELNAVVGAYSEDRKDFKGSPFGMGGRVFAPSDVSANDLEVFAAIHNINLQGDKEEDQTPNGLRYDLLA